MRKDTIDLKPCPKCSSYDIEIIVGEEDDGSYTANINCNQCGYTEHAEDDTSEFLAMRTVQRQWNEHERDK